jgi:hypothetical protein
MRIRRAIIPAILALSAAGSIMVASGAPTAGSTVTCRAPNGAQVCVYYHD